MPSRDEIEKEVESDLTKDPRHLLVDVHEELLNDNLPQEKLIHAQKRLASLFVTLYRKSEKSTQKLTNLTYALLFLTVALLVVAVVQIVMFKQNSNTNPQGNQTTSNRQPQQTISESKPIIVVPPPIKTKQGNEIKRK